MSRDLENLLKTRSARVGIIGLGYVGLPLAILFAEKGFDVTGFDILPERVDSANKGQSYVDDVNNRSLAASIAAGRFRATTDFGKLREMDVISVCVPTPLTEAKEPDLSFIRDACTEIAGNLTPGKLIVLESTTYPGTTREVMLPILEKSGLKAGAGFYLAYSPERVDPGNKKFNTRNTPKLVGGLDVRSGELAALFYGQAVDRVIPVSSPEVAEMAKVFENVFRNVNIALVNELAQLCQRMGISVWDVIQAASSKPFGYVPFTPGPGIGGHCIPLDPYYLAFEARKHDFHTKFIELAAAINEEMPYYVTRMIMDALNSNGKSLKGADVLLLGITYKKDIADVRESPALKLIEILRGKGANLSYNDPMATKLEHGRIVMSSVELTAERLASADCVVIATDHSGYDYAWIAEHSRLVFDARGATRNLKNTNIRRLGEG